MVDFAHGIGVDRLEVAHLTAFNDEMDAESLRHTPEQADKWLRLARSRADQLGFRVHLPPLMNGQRLEPSRGAKLRLATKEFSEINPKRIQRLARTVRKKARARKWAQKAGGSIPCQFLNDGVFITLKGDVAPCPMPGRPIAGNLMESSFADIWNGPILTRMRKGLVQNDPLECCAHCSQNGKGFIPSDAQTIRPAVQQPGVPLPKA
jgi:MoaA/NifB/PqqE/SkfB family radical SAM enzyme